MYWRSLVTRAAKIWPRGLFLGGGGMEGIDALIGLHAKPDELTFGQVSLRAFLVYAAVITLVRVGKKRFLAQATAFDAILLVLIGSVASRAISGTAPFFATLLAVGVLIAVHSAFSYLSCRWPTFSGLVKGNPTLVVKDGQVVRQALKGAHMSDGDLEEDLRKNGVADISKITEARIERDGTLSVLPK
jgi:uncharacterized membrane protein YcaP (DUF421 family)